MRWTGDLACALAVAREPAVSLVVPPDPLLEAQVAAMGRGAAPWRVIVVGSTERDRVGKVVGADEVLPDDATFVIDGPIFARRVEVVAGDIIEDGARWRLTLGVRGC